MDWGSRLGARNVSLEKAVLGRGGRATKPLSPVAKHVIILFAARPASFYFGFFRLYAGRFGLERLENYVSVNEGSGCDG